MQFFIEVAVTIVTIILVTLLKHKFLSKKWLERLIGAILLLIFIGIPIALPYKKFIMGLLYFIILLLLLPTGKILDNLKKCKSQ